MKKIKEMWEKLKNLPLHKKVFIILWIILPFTTEVTILYLLGKKIWKYQQQ